MAPRGSAGAAVVSSPTPAPSEAPRPVVTTAERTVAKGWSDLRRESGLSLRELERQTGLNRGVLSLIFRGRMCPLPDQAEVLLRVLRGGG